MIPYKILVVINEKSNRQRVCDILDKYGFSTIQAKNLSSALKQIDFHSPTITLFDTNLPDSQGIKALHEIRKRQPTTITILMADDLLINEVISAFRAGVYDIISKPLNPEELLSTINNAIEKNDLSFKDKSFSDEKIPTFNFDQIIGESDSIKETISMARKVANSDVSCVLLQGESGTGKDLLAKSLHYSSERAHKPFVAINCAAIPANLLESELFGFEKGAFTDAKALKEGLFEQAEGGTIFLDEIGELDIGLQAKLLRVLEEGTFRRVGGLRDLPLNVRVIASSNRNLKSESEENRFRQDLYYRLSIIQLELPPLRQRGEDVILLADYFIKKLDKKWLQKTTRTLSPEVKDAFRRYRWKGNVRELRNIIERALILEDNQIITLKYLPKEISENGKLESYFPQEELSKASLYFTLPPEGISLDIVEEWLIQEALQRSGGNVTRASAILRITRDRLRYRLKKNKS